MESTKESTSNDRAEGDGSRSKIQVSKAKASFTFYCVVVFSSKKATDIQSFNPSASSLVFPSYSPNGARTQ